LLHSSWPTGCAVRVGAGFLGLMLVIQPRAEGFNYYALVCLVGTLFHAARDLQRNSQNSCYR